MVTSTHHTLITALYEGLTRSHGVAPSRPTSVGPTTGWTLRADRLNAHALRFDWIAGSLPRVLPSDLATARADRSAAAILTAAADIATAAGFRVRPDGTGLYLTPVNPT